MIHASFLKYFLILTGLFACAGLHLIGQVHRVGGGIVFSSGAEFNDGGTGNPGLTVKTWLALDKRSALSIVPSVTVFNRYRQETGYSVLCNYMVHGDLDMQYAFFTNREVRVTGFGGGNFIYLLSQFNPVRIAEDGYNDIASDYTFGGNLGAGLELHMAPKWDFNVSGKYIFSRYTQFIISVQGVYYFKKQGRSYRR